MNAIPHIGNLLDDQLDGHAGVGGPRAGRAKALAAVQARLEASGKPLIDLVGALNRPASKTAVPA